MITLEKTLPVGTVVETDLGTDGICWVSRATVIPVSEMGDAYGLSASEWRELGIDPVAVVTDDGLKMWIPYPDRVITQG